MKKILERFKVLVGFHPYLVLTALVFLILILIAVAYFWGQWIQDSVINQCVVQFTTQLISSLFFLFILWQLCLLKASGFTRMGRSKTWSVAAMFLIYMVVINIYLRTGEFFFELSDPDLTFWLSLSSLVAGLFEETVFRGVVLFIFLWLWRGSKYCVAKSVSISALLFGCISILRLDGNSLFQILLSMLVATLAGFFYGAILLHGRSIWIPIVFHGLHNVGINLNMIGKDAIETPQTSLYLLLAYIPLFAVALHLLKKIPRR